MIRIIYVFKKLIQNLKLFIRLSKLGIWCFFRRFVPNVEKKTLVILTLILVLFSVVLFDYFFFDCKLRNPLFILFNNWLFIPGLVFFNFKVICWVFSLNKKNFSCFEYLWFFFPVIIIVLFSPLFFFLVLTSFSFTFNTFNNEEFLSLVRFVCVFLTFLNVFFLFVKKLKPKVPTLTKDSQYNCVLLFYVFFFGTLFMVGFGFVEYSTIFLNKPVFSSDFEIFVSFWLFLLVLIALVWRLLESILFFRLKTVVKPRFFKTCVINFLTLFTMVCFFIISIFIFFLFISLKKENLVVDLPVFDIILFKNGIVSWQRSFSSSEKEQILQVLLVHFKVDPAFIKSLFFDLSVFLKLDTVSSMQQYVGAGVDQFNYQQSQPSFLIWLHSFLFDEVYPVEMNFSLVSVIGLGILAGLDLHIRTEMLRQLVLMHPVFFKKFFLITEVVCMFGMTFLFLHTSLTWFLDWFS